MYFKIRNNTVIRDDSSTIVSDTINYLTADFYFSATDWDGLTKSVTFTQDETSYQIFLVNDKITEDKHLNLTVGNWIVSVTGTNSTDSMRVTTVPCTITVAASGVINGEPLTEIPLSTAEQILQQATTANTNAADALAQVESIHDDTADSINAHNISTSAHADIRTSIETKVTKVTGKALSANDFTDALAAKLGDIDYDANNYILPTDVVRDADYDSRLGDTYGVNTGDQDLSPYPKSVDVVHVVNNELVGGTKTFTSAVVAPNVSKLIKATTLTTAASSITINTNTAGSVFSIDSARLSISIPATSIPVGTGVWIALKVNAITSGYVGFDSANATKGLEVAVAAKNYSLGIINLTNGLGITHAESIYYCSDGTNTINGDTLVSYVPNTSNITSLTFYPNTGLSTFPIGTKVELYGEKR